MAEQIKFTILGDDKLSGTLKRTGDRLKQIGKIAAAAGAAAAAGLGGVFAVAKKTATEMDELTKSAQRLGLTAAELSKLRHAADLSGISATNLNTSMQRLLRVTQEAREGLSTATRAFQDLGLNADKVAKLPLSQQMSVVADALSKVDDKATQATAAYRLFGRAGVDMLTMTQGGSKAFEQMAADAEFLGLTISEKAAKNAERFMDQMTRMRGATQGIRNAFAEDLYPVFTVAMKGIADWVAANRDNFVAWAKDSIRNIIAFGSVLKDIGQTFYDIFTGNTQVLSRFLDNFVKFVGGLGASFIAFAPVIPKSLWEAVKSATSILNDFGRWVGAKLASIFEGSRDPGTFGEAMAESLTHRFAEAAAAISQEFHNAVPVIELAAGDMASAVGGAFGTSWARAREEADIALEQFAAQMETFQTDVVTSTGATIEALGELSDAAGAKLGEQFESLSEALADRRNTWLEENGNIYGQFADMIMSTTDTIASGVGQAFANAVVEGQNMLQSFKKLGKQVLATIIQMFVQMAVKRLLMSTVFKAATTAEGAAEGARAVGTAAANMFASVAGAPWPISLTAPAAAASALAGATSILAAGRAAGAAAGVAHDGLTTVPQTGTFLLQEGERVVKRNQNRDLTDFLANRGKQDAVPMATAASVTIGTVEMHIMENATNAESLANMSRLQWREVFEGEAIPALNDAFASGLIVMGGA